MLPRNRISRRRFVAGTALALTAFGRSEAANAAPKIIGFIKPFQNLPLEEIAAIAREAGWDGIELPVRSGGTVEPTRVETDLPRVQTILERAGIEITMLATDVADARDPVGLRVLKKAGELGIRRYRIKHLRYDLDRAIAPQVAEFGAILHELAAMNKELRLQGCVQNHSGATYLGAPVWDLWQILKDVEPASLGIYFDIAHATIEGGLSWPLEARLVQPILTTVSVKDFVWKRRGAKENGWEATWCPLGEGMVHSDFFRLLRSANFSGPISMHFEYDLPEGPKRLAALRKDTETLKRWLA